nr:Sensor protein [uncultured bacterium]
MRPDAGTDHRRWLYEAIGLLAAISFAVMSFSIWILYETAFQEEGARLVELAKTQAILIDAMAASEESNSRPGRTEEAVQSTLGHIEKAQRDYPGFGESGEFAFGRREGANIVILLSGRHVNRGVPVSVPWESTLAEPMRRALRGESGTVIDLDYRAAKVLAAFEPVRRLNAGVVAKIDLAEIRRPFLRAAGVCFVSLLLMIAIGASLFRRISVPLIEGEKAMGELRKLHQSIEQSPLMIFITDREGRIEYVNPRFCEITGYSVDEVIGRNPRILNSGDMPREFFAELWSTLLSGRQFKAEIKDRRKDGSSFWAQIVTSPVRNKEGLITHFVAVHEDITQRKQAEQATQAAREQAEIANRAKTELLANMSHELRTPLNAIIGFSEGMKLQLFGPLGSAKYEEYAEDINASGQHLLKLINDILDVSAIEAGKTTLQEELLNVVEIAETSLRLVRARAEKGSVSLFLEASDGLPPLLADGRRIKQILLNLLSNAVKFTPEGGRVTLKAGIDEVGRLHLAVADTGIGMDEKELTLAMTEFGQVDGGLDRRHEGTGLGLPLTKGLVEIHGGIFSVESKKGHGTTASAIFPASRLKKNGET